MEVEHLLVPLRDCLHFTVTLVADAVVNKLKVGEWEHIVDDLLHVMLAEVREERSLVVNTLDKSVDSVSVGFHRSHDH